MRPLRPLLRRISLSCLILFSCAAAAAEPSAGVLALTAPAPGMAPAGQEDLVPPAPPRAEITVMPEYPPAARRARFDGRVLLAGTIDRAGRVVDLKSLAEGPDPAGFEASALRAVALWSYRPAVNAAGETVPVLVVFDVRFRP